MHEWPAEIETKLSQATKTQTQTPTMAMTMTMLPTADLSLSLPQFTQLCLLILDIPIKPGGKKNRKTIDALSVLFTIYSEFKNNQHFAN